MRRKKILMISLLIITACGPEQGVNGTETWYKRNESEVLLQITFLGSLLSRYTPFDTGSCLDIRTSLPAILAAKPMQDDLAPRSLTSALNNAEKGAQACIEGDTATSDTLFAEGRADFQTLAEQLKALVGIEIG